MKNYGCCVPVPYSTADRGVPLPTRTDSGRDVFTDLARAHEPHSPIHLRPLTRAETTALLDADNERAAPEARASRTETPKRTPRPARPLLDVDRLITLYTDGLTASAVAAEVGCSDKTVYRVLDDHRVPRREDRGRTGHHGRNNHRTDPPALIATLTDLYTTQGHTITETAYLLGVSRNVVRNALIRNGIERRPPAARVAANNAAGLKNLMAVNGVSSADVRTWAKDTGRTVALQGIPPRHLVEAFLLLHRIRPADR